VCQAEESTTRRRKFDFRDLTPNLAGAGRAASASYTLIGGILLLGGGGYLLDARWGTGPWLLVVGLVLGIVVGFYEIVKSTWPR
jgi:F0F1-type ATP synthase assembly protein I